nr:hypothetical protein [Tanacetum cinerariifolium]
AAATLTGAAIVIAAAGTYGSAAELVVLADTFNNSSRNKRVSIQNDFPQRVISHQKKMRIEQYFLMTDYSLWEVILNGDSLVPTRIVEVRVAAASTKRRKRVVIKDPEEESTTIIPVDSKSKDKGKGIMVEEPKPLKKKQQVEMDDEYARKLHEELNKDIDWDVAIDHVKKKAKEDLTVQRYQVMKKRLQTEAQARKNMIMYLKNAASFRLDYFKLEEEENRAIQSIYETPAQKAANRRKLNEEVEDLKRHLEIVPDEDGDVNTEATPLARKILKKNTKCLMLLVKNLVLPSKSLCCWISAAEGRINVAESS